MLTTKETRNSEGRQIHRLLVMTAVSVPIIFLVVALLS